MWLLDYLPDTIPSARILTYGYPAKVISDASDTKIETIAQNFLRDIYSLRTSKVSCSLIWTGMTADSQRVGCLTPNHLDWTFHGRTCDQEGRSVYPFP
jgi:hypothetical protein